MTEAFLKNKMALEVSNISSSEEWSPPLAKKIKQCGNESELNSVKKKMKETEHGREEKWKKECGRNEE